MEKLIGRILNYITRETVEVGKTTMLRSEPLKKYILELYEQYNQPINNDDIALLLSLIPLWAREVPEGLDPTMYGTGTYGGDLEIKQRVDEIKRKLVKCI